MLHVRVVRLVETFVLTALPLQCEIDTANVSQVQAGSMSSVYPSLLSSR